MTETENLELELSVEQMPFLKDHIVHNTIIFPAAGYLDIILANFTEETDTKIVFTNVLLKAPLLFGMDEIKTLSIEFSPKQDGKQFAISSKNADGSETQHVDGLIKNLPYEKPAVLNETEFETLKKGYEKALDSDTYYSMYKKAGITYGPFFKSISGISYNREKQSACSLIHLGAEAQEDEEIFTLHPARMDGAFQTVGIFSMVSPENDFFLPFCIEKIEIFAPLKGDYFCRVQGSAKNSPAGKKKNYSIDLINTDGTVALKIPGFILKSVPQAKQPAPETETETETKKAAGTESGAPEKAGYSPTDVAIIGIACRFPEAPDKNIFWENVKKGISSIKEVPKERWDMDEIYDKDPDNPTKSNCKWGGFLSDIDEFDPMFFGVSVKKAALIDPQQRIMLQLAWNALEDAGYANGQLENSQTGVFVGVSSSDYIHVSKPDPQKISAHAAAGNTLSTIPNRISYALGLQGPSMAIDSACSSSLVALNDAWTNICNGNCDYALAGGVNLTLNPNAHIIFTKSGVLSSTGKCRPFDDYADGYLRGEGAAVVLLKPLNKALEDNDHIYSVIKGIAVNHSGKTNGLNTPNAPAQTRVILEASKKAGFTLDTVSYIEAHATGTPMGDSIEFRGLQSAFRRHSNEPGFCALGTVKGNLGHMEPASGMAGIIKTSLMLQEAVLTPMINFVKPNYRINLVNSPFYVSDCLREWPKMEFPRRAGISCFGFGGTNCHVILEEAPAGKKGEKKKEAAGAPKHPPLLTVSGKHLEAVKLQAAQLAELLNSPADLDLNDVCSSLSYGRGHFPIRLAVTGKDRKEMAGALQNISYEQDMEKGPVFGCVKKKSRPKTLFLCDDTSGASMQEFCEKDPYFAECAADYKRVLTEAGWNYDNELLNDKKVQAFIFKFTLSKLFVKYGIKADLYSGSGTGLLVSLAASGSLTLSKAVAYIKGKETLELEKGDDKVLFKNKSGGYVMEKLESSSLDQIDLKNNLEEMREHAEKEGLEYIIDFKNVKKFEDINLIVAQSYGKGVNINWNEYHNGNFFHKVSLPVYQFKKNKYWIH